MASLKSCLCHSILMGIPWSLLMPDVMVQYDTFMFLPVSVWNAIAIDYSKFWTSWPIVRSLLIGWPLLSLSLMEMVFTHQCKVRLTMSLLLLRYLLTLTISLINCSLPCSPKPGVTQHIWLIPPDWIVRQTCYKWACLNGWKLPRRMFYNHYVLWQSGERLELGYGYRTFSPPCTTAGFQYWFPVLTLVFVGNGFVSKV